MGHIFYIMDAMSDLPALFTIIACDTSRSIILSLKIIVNRDET